MIEIQCTSCHTRYRIDERVLPEDTPTFKCSRCGHVFNAEPRDGKRAPRGFAPVRAQPPRPPALRIDDDEGVARARRRASAADPIPEAAQPPPRPVAPQKPLDASPGAVDPEQDNPLARSFAYPEDSVEEPEIERNGENLAFRFGERVSDRSDPTTATVKDKHDDWEVGYPPKEFAAATAGAGPSPLGHTEKRAPSREVETFSSERKLGVDSINPASAQVALPKSDFDSSALSSRLHSSGFFVGMIFLVTLAFGIVTVAIVGSPAISAGIISNLPILNEHFRKPDPAPRRVALTNLRGQYHYLKDGAGGPALIITGEAHNVSPSPLHLVQIVVTLIGDDGRDLQRTSFYCGNAISSRTVSEMTAREISFFQGLQPPAAFTLAPDASWNFVLVFPNPSARQNRFRIAVVKAEAQAGGSDTAMD